MYWSAQTKAKLPLISAFFSPISSERKHLLLEPFLLTRPWVGKSWGRQSLAVWTQMSLRIIDGVRSDVSFSIRSSKECHNFSIRLFAPFVRVCVCEGCQSQKIWQLSRKLVEFRAARRFLTGFCPVRSAELRRILPTADALRKAQRSVLLEIKKLFVGAWRLRKRINILMHLIS